MTWGSREFFILPPVRSATFQKIKKFFLKELESSVKNIYTFEGEDYTKEVREADRAAFYSLMTEAERAEMSGAGAQFSNAARQRTIVDLKTMKEDLERTKENQERAKEERRQRLWEKHGKNSQ